MIHRNDKTFMCSIQVLILKWAKILKKMYSLGKPSKGRKNMVIQTERHGLRNEKANNSINLNYSRFVLNCIFFWLILEQCV